ncbi:C-type lectin domain family 11 member A [Rhinatrema bivittatum]|uniref:C-type lectin domain family 11 member A n=1 Tax=Rhinatrema bivittatum TaxID=194408 RepID=UPI00112CE25E|nr:C-type lectin domain family 11 member A [Rhinatrema bivittatum]
MIWGRLLLVLVGQSWIPAGHAAETTELGLGAGKQKHLLETISQGRPEAPETAAQSPVGHPEHEPEASSNRTEGAEGSQGNVEEGDKSHGFPGQTALPTTAAAEDNFSYIFSRLSAMDAAIHRLNVQFHSMDVKLSQLSQNVAKLRTKLDDNQDTISSLSEMNTRSLRQIGQLEGCLKGRRFTRKCYLLFLHFESYAAAQQLCHGRGGSLAMPADQQEYAALAQYVHDALSPFNWPVWIGINDQRSEGMYLYESGHRVSFFNWYKDHLVTQPNGGTVENCISVSSDDGKWWDNDCSRRMYYVCEY